jgi:hypothetical protein
MYVCVWRGEVRDSFHEQNMTFVSFPRTGVVPVVGESDDDFVLKKYLDEQHVLLFLLSYFTVVC